MELGGIPWGVHVQVQVHVEVEVAVEVEDAVEDAVVARGLATVARWGSRWCGGQR